MLVPGHVIPQCLIFKFLGDYNLHEDYKISRPPYLLERPSLSNTRMLRDMNFINSPYALDDPPAGMDPVSKSEGNKPIE